MTPSRSTPAALRLPLAAVCIVLIASLAGPARAATFYVSADGADADDRGGRSPDAAWRSLAYACDRIPEGEHTLQLGPGLFPATRPSRPKSGLTIVGAGTEGDGATRIVASTDWPVPQAGAAAEAPPDRQPEDEYLVFLQGVSNVTIRNLVLASEPEHRITGGLLGRNVKGVTVAEAYVHDFAWTGLRFEHSSGVVVRHCTIRNASTERRRWHGGLISSRWLHNSAFHHNRVISDVGGGYGYKGGGHRNVRFHHNVIDVAGEFAIESAHENEYDVEIDHNYLTRCISVPKGGQGADPTKEGHEYSFWIHHNLLTDSYTVEGPRNHLRLSHNYIRIEKTGGRVYTHHGGTNHGPVWIHHNVVENLDRAFIWMNNGLAENIYVYHNTVFCADAGDRTGSILDAWTAERLDNWVVKNNIFVAPADRPRKLMPEERGVPGKIIAADNLCVNVTAVPEGNHVGVDPGLRGEGAKPWPYFAPAGPASFVVDRGVDVGLPFEGKAPDLGAYEFGREAPFPDVPSP